MSVVLRVALSILILLIYNANSGPSKCDGETCAQCIGQSVDCVWCSAENHTGPRCQSNIATNSSWCSGELHNPLPSDFVKVISHDRISSDPKRVIQLAPQILEIIVRPGQTVEFPIEYKPAKDYPLDIYYLMDASYTMKNSIWLLKKQGKTIYETLTNFTNNVRLGVGSFIEKPALPFANPFTQGAYAFKHHLNLTTDRNSFTKVLDNIRSGSNYDIPEAGLDALMQVMACKDKLDWRDNARKIIVLCTDSTYHSAGDGKIVGAAKLNDMKCHLNNDNVYSLELEQDYPTVNQIRKIAKRENIIVIFNVMGSVIREYEALADTLGGGAEVIELKDESDSITKAITKVYTSKLGFVQMQVSVPDRSNVRVKLTQESQNVTKDCTIKDTCKVEHAANTKIQVSITTDVCLDKDAKNIVKVKPSGLGETLEVKINTLCQCECEKRPRANASECSGSGYLVCGVCECNPNRFGEKCECIGSATNINLEMCKAPPKDTVVCKGVGSCICGKCDCGPDYSGKYCQFDNRVCSTDDQGKLCSGHGTCRLGSCQCTGGWTGSACECPPDDSGCRAPYSGKVCSGNGHCDCGKCNCTKLDSKNKLYFGAYCDDCYDCDGNRCKDLEKYVLCVYTNETTKEECDEKFKTKNTEVIIVNKTEINAPKYHLAKRCIILREDGKSIIFKNKYEHKTLRVIIQKELEEPDNANLWIAIGSSIGAILLIGLLSVIIWKILVDIYDAREYDRFNKLLDESGDIANINQIYKAPTVNFNNPLFKRRSRFN